MAPKKNPLIQLTNEQLQTIVVDPPPAQPITPEIAQRQAETISSIHSEVDQCIQNTYMQIASNPDILITKNIIDKSLRFPIQNRGNLIVSFKASFKPD